MKNLIVFAALAVASNLHAQTITRVEQVPPDVTRTQERLARHLAPSAKQKLQSAASILLTQVDPKQSDTLITQSARLDLTSAFPGIGPQDIDAVVFLLLNEAASQDETTLKAIINEMQKADAQKTELRAMVAKANRGKSPARPPHISVVTAIPPTYLRAPAPLPPNATVAEMHQRLDELSDMSQQDQLLLQTLMDRREKLVSMMSNVMKTYSPTADGIVSKLK